MTNKMHSRPPVPKSVEDFIAGPETATGDSASTTSASRAVSAGPHKDRQRRRPWEAAKVREDVIKTYNLRLPEPYMLKLRYIGEHTPESMQRFCLGVLLPAIDKKLQDIK